MCLVVNASQLKHVYAYITDTVESVHSPDQSYCWNASPSDWAEHLIREILNRLAIFPARQIYKRRHKFSFQQSRDDAAIRYARCVVN